MSGKSVTRRKKAKKGRKRRVLKYILGSILLGGFLCGLFVYSVYVGLWGPLPDYQELKEKLQYYAAGEAVSITVQSPGEGGIYTEKELTITLSSAQSSEESQSTDNTQAAPEKGNGTHKAMGYQN